MVEIGNLLAALGAVCSMLLAVVVWVALRLVRAIDQLTSEVKLLETRMALLEFRMERLPCGKVVSGGNGEADCHNHKETR